MSCIVKIGNVQYRKAGRVASQNGLKSEERDEGDHGRRHVDLGAARASSDRAKLVGPAIFFETLKIDVER